MRADYFGLKFAKARREAVHGAGNLNPQAGGRVGARLAAVRYDGSDSTEAVGDVRGFANT